MKKDNMQTLEQDSFNLSENVLRHLDIADYFDAGSYKISFQVSGQPQQILQRTEKLKNKSLDEYKEVDFTTFRFKSKNRVSDTCCHRDVLGCNTLWVLQVDPVYGYVFLGKKKSIGKKLNGLPGH